MKKTKPLYSSPCSLGEIEEQNKKKTLKDVYSLIAELWNSPPENNKNREKIKKDSEKVIKKLKNINSESAELLSKFLNENKLEFNQFSIQNNLVYESIMSNIFILKFTLIK